MQLSICFADQPKVEHNFVLQRILGKGKFFVYHAKSSSLDRQLALKMFTKGEQSRFHYTREEEFLSKINHKNVIKYFKIMNHSLPYDVIATEFTPNCDFFDFVTQGGLRSEKLIRTYFRQLVEGIEYLHSQEIAHSDIKLENLLLDKDFNLKIIDFDQAQYANDSEGKPSGTIGYRPPEVIEHRCRNLKAVDIYSAGVVLFVFLAGEMPFAECKRGDVRDSAKYAVFKESKERLWRLKDRELKVNLDDDVKELLNGMWEEKVDRRLKIEDVKKSSWYNGDVYTQEELKVKVAKIVSKMERN